MQAGLQILSAHVIRHCYAVGMSMLFIPGWIYYLAESSTCTYANKHLKEGSGRDQIHQ
jgi:hypothetical protein